MYIIIKSSSPVSAPFPVLSLPWPLDLRVALLVVVLLPVGRSPSKRVRPLTRTLVASIAVHESPSLTVGARTARRLAIMLIVNPVLLRCLTVANHHVPPS